MAIGEGVEVLLAAKFQALFPHLDERQRRLAAGAEARSLGHGGIRVVARAAGMREATVSDGVAELESGAAPLGRVRRPGGGRKRLTDLDPGLVPALLALVEPEERGDPESPLRWTTRSLRDLAGALTAAGHQVGPDTVADLLRKEGFSLQGTAKVAEGRVQHPDRDAQFRYLNEQVKEHLASGDPVVSVDAKKKELVGNFAVPGRSWRPAGKPVAVNSHTFFEDAAGVAIPFGVYDMAGNTGWVNVGVDHCTAAFAVQSIRRWWNDVGRTDHPGAGRLLITADAGGANDHRSRTWKTELAAFALETGLRITVCHLPPGTSKWNKIEHRLFSAITTNWRGRPLTSYEVVVNSIAATRSRTGLQVRAALDAGTYPAGIRIGDRQWAALPLERHQWHGQWNYTLLPEPPRELPEPTLLDVPSPHTGWLGHPALTGITPTDWDAMVGVLTDAHDARHTTDHGHRRGGRPPLLTMADRLIAVVLSKHHRIPQPAIAALFGVRTGLICVNIGETSKLLAAAGHRIPPAEHRLATLDDLRDLAAAHGITPPDEIKPAC